MARLTDTFIRDGGAPQLPQEIQRHWRIVANKDTLALPLYRLADRREVAASLVVLLGLSDETCLGVGLPMNDSSRGSERTLFHESADQMLFPSQFGSTLCRYVHPSAGRVLPKTHTAQCGLTIRSFSHHLAFCETDEVQPSWLSVPGARGDVQNTHHSTSDCAVARSSETGPDEAYSTGEYQFQRILLLQLQCRREPFGNHAQTVGQATSAERLVGSLDAVVMPELALSTYDYRAVRAALLRRGILFDQRRRRPSTGESPECRRPTQQTSRSAFAAA